MIFNMLSSNFVMGPVLPPPRTQTRSQSRQINKIMGEFNTEMGCEKQDGTLSFYRHQSKHGAISITRAPISSTSELSPIQSHPFPTVIWMKMLDEINCSQLECNDEENELDETDEQQIQEREAERRAYENFLRGYEDFLRGQKRPVSYEALGSGFESERRSQTLASFRDKIGLSPATFSVRPATQEEDPNQIYFQLDGESETHCKQVHFGNELNRAKFIVGEPPQGLDNFIKPQFRENRFICCLILFGRVVNLHVFDTCADKGDHCRSLHEQGKLPPFDQINAGDLKRLGLADTSWIKHDTLGQADDQIEPSIRRRCEAQNIYMFFL